MGCSYGGELARLGGLGRMGEMIYKAELGSNILTLS